MEKISIARLRELIQCRVANPQEYKGKSLILWDCDYTRDGILYQIIKESCIDYNMTHPKEDGAWLKEADYCFMVEDYTTTSDMICDEGDMFGVKNKGILLVTGCCGKEHKDHLRTFINTHIYEKGHLSENLAMVACGHSCYFTPDMFGSNCEIYELVIDVDEWGEFMMKRCDESLCRFAVAYIKEYGFGIRILSWMRAIYGLKTKMKLKDIADITQLSRTDFNMGFSEGECDNWPEFGEVMNNFYEFIHREE